MTANWGPIGPGSGGGKVGSAVSPADSNIAIVVSDVGGIYRTADGGAHWSPRNAHLATPTGGAFNYSIIVDPQFHPVDANYVLAGAYRSTDAGLTWNLDGANSSDFNPQAIAFDPSNKNLRYLGEIPASDWNVPSNHVKVVQINDSTLVRSESAPFGPCGSGAHMTINSLVVDGGNTARVFAATTCGLFMSTNSGATFAVLTGTGYLPYDGAGGINKLIQRAAGGGSYLWYAATTSPGTQYAGIGQWLGGVFQSTNGTTWTPAFGAVGSPLNVNTTFEGDPNFPIPDWSGSSGGFEQSCTAPHPANPPTGCHLRFHSATSVPVWVRSGYVPVTQGARYRVTLDALIETQGGSGTGLDVLVYWYKDNAGTPAPMPPPWDGPNHFNFSVPLRKSFSDGLYFPTPLEADVTAPAQAQYARVQVQTWVPNTTTHVDNVKFSPSTALPRAANYSELTADGSGTLYTSALAMADGSGPDSPSGAWKSTDQGANWTKSMRSFFPSTSGDVPNITYRRAIERGRQNYLDSQSLSMGNGPSASRAYFGTGLWLYTTNDGGANWTETATTQVGSPPDNDAYYGGFNDVVIGPIALDIRNRNRLFYGDADNHMLVTSDLDDPNTTDQSPTFQMQSKKELINASDPNMSGDFATSIVIDPLDSNHIFVGTNTTDRLAPGKTTPSGVIEARPNGTVWDDWFHESPILAGGADVGGVQLALDGSVSPRKLYAAVFSKGMFRRDADADGDHSADFPGTWQSLNPPTGTWSPTPATWNIFRVASTPSGRLYAGFGHPDGVVGTSGDTGVWRTIGGTSWTKITPDSMDNEPVLALLPVGDSTLYVGTSSLNVPGKGGLYKGTCTGTCGSLTDWSWARKIPTGGSNTQTLYVTGVVASPESSKVLYAMVSQDHAVTDSAPPGKAGLWTSRDAGANWYWVANNGLMNLWDVNLAAWPADPNATDEPKTLYAGTFGSGVFQGTVTCTAPDPNDPNNPMTGDYDHDGRNNFCDNCPNDFNPNQADADQDGVGNVCQTISASLASVGGNEDARIAAGGALDTNMTDPNALRIGDGMGNKQWKSIVSFSFDTLPLPANAVVTSATLQLRRGGNWHNPYTTTFGTAWVDIATPFGSSAMAQSSDFQQSAGVTTKVGTLSKANNNGDLSTAPLNAGALSGINSAMSIAPRPHVQFRIYFNGASDNDNTADFIGYYSGANGTAGNKPTLNIQYHLPDN